MKKRLTLAKAAVLILSCVFAFGGCGKEDELLPKDNNEAVVEIETEAPIEIEATEEPAVEPEATEEPTKAPMVTEEVTIEPEAAEEPKGTDKSAVTAAPKATDKPAATEAPKVTVAPTAEPTKAPVVTEAPKVTVAPTQEPTQAPVVTTAPTQAPVVTAAPTTAPTAAPVVTEAPVAHTHTWDGGTVTLAATCSTEGVKTYTCSGCSETKTEAIPATGEHELIQTWNLGQTPTCTNGGTLSTSCANCGEYFGYEDVPSLEHNWEYTQRYAGACERPASYSRVCKDCGFEGSITYGDLNPDVHDFKTYTDEVWNEETWVWETVTSTCCSDCGKLKE